GAVADLEDGAAGHDPLDGQAAVELLVVRVAPVPHHVDVHLLELGADVVVEVDRVRPHHAPGVRGRAVEADTRRHGRAVTRFALAAHAIVLAVAGVARVLRDLVGVTVDDPGVGAGDPERGTIQHAEHGIPLRAPEAAQMGVPRIAAGRPGADVAGAWIA